MTFYKIRWKFVRSIISQALRFVAKMLRMRLTEQCSFQCELLCFGGRPGAPSLFSSASILHPASLSVAKSHQLAGHGRHWRPRKITHELLKENVYHGSVQFMTYLWKTMSFSKLEHKVQGKWLTSYFIKHGFYFLSNHKLRTKNTKHNFFFFYLLKWNQREFLKASSHCCLLGTRLSLYLMDVLCQVPLPLGVKISPKKPGRNSRLLKARIKLHLMCIVHFYYPEMICYNYLLKSCEKNLNTLLTNDNIPKSNQFGAGLSREKNSG